MNTKYTGKPCAYCKVIFNENDDVVVCPDCGAPHHRECYKKLGHCACESRHGEAVKWSSAGEGWGPKHEEVIDGNAPLRCPRCATLCKPGVLFCPVCGSNLLKKVGGPGQNWDSDYPPWTEEQLKKLCDDIFSSEYDLDVEDPEIKKELDELEAQEEQEEQQERERRKYENPYSTGGGRVPPGRPPHSPYGYPGGTNQAGRTPPIPLNPFTTPYGGVAPEEEIDGIPARDMVLFVGPNSHYYLPRFKMIAGKIGKVQWNWSAFFFHFIYFFYRKMYLAGALFLGAYLLIQLPMFLTLPDYIHYLYDALTSSSMFTTMPSSVQWYMNYSYIANFILLALGMAASLAANRIYYKKVCKDVGLLRQEWLKTEGEKPEEAVSPERQLPDSQEYFAALARKGRVNMKIVLIMMVCTMFINFGIPALAVFWLT